LYSVLIYHIEYDIKVAQISRPGDLKPHRDMRRVTMFSIFSLLVIATTMGWQSLIGDEEIEMASLGRRELWVL
jgi:hypothetical protein